MKARFYVAYCCAVFLALCAATHALGLGQATVQLGSFHMAPQQP